MIRRVSRFSCVIGAMIFPFSRSPFSRGRVVLGTSNGDIVQVQRWNAGLAEGALLQPEDWDELCSAEHAVRFDGAEAQPFPGCEVWSFNRNFIRREKAESVMPSFGQRLPKTGDRSYWLVRPSIGPAVEWSKEAISQALSHWTSDAPIPMLWEAEQAFALSRNLDPETLALLHLAYLVNGRHVGAEGLIEMARRSRGEDLVYEIQDQIKRLRQRKDKDETT